MGGSAFINGVEYKEFDNFYNISFYMNGKLWDSAEKAYQALKFKDEKYVERIRKETDMSMIIHLGHTEWIEYIHGWDNTLINNKLKNDPFINHSRINLMYRVNLEKFKQNSKIAKMLVTSSGKIQCKGSTHFWNKWNSLILEKIREEIKSNMTHNDLCLN